MNNDKDLIAQNNNIKQFWEAHTCGTIGLTDEINVEKYSDEYFDHIERHRYEVEPWVHEYALFTQYWKKNVLEIGCGAGTDALQFCKANANYTGIDLTESGINHTRLRLNHFGFKPSLHQVSAHKMNFNKDTFDLVYSWGVIHHSPYTDEIIGKIYDVLKPGGKFVVLLYNTYSWVVFKTLIKHGLVKGEIFSLGFKKMMSKHTESDDKLNPLTKTFTRRQCINLFSNFDNVRVTTRISRADKRNLPFISNFSFGGRIGWHNIVTGNKPYE